MGQSRIPGIVILALIILLVGIFSLLQWMVQQTYGSDASNLVWPFFGIAVALLLIGLWALTRSAPRR